MATQMNKKTYDLANLNWLNTIFLLSTPLVAILGTIAWLRVDGFSWDIVIYATIYYIFCGLGITMGYHRLFSHRAYKAHPILKVFFLIFGGCALQNTALKWSNDHRVHHTKVDSPEDPYNIKEGFFYAHMGWILLNNEISDYRQSKDLMADKLVMLQDKYYFPMIVIFGFIIPALIGHFLCNSLLGGIFVIGFLRIVLLHHCTFLINSLCHMLGSRPYDKHQTARDSWFTALFTFGEGYHNYHHTFQTDYRNGIRWYHFDPSKWLIKSFSFVGLTWDLKQTKESIILAKMIEANINQVDEDSTFADICHTIREKTKALQIKLRSTKDSLVYNQIIEEMRILLKQSQALA